MTRACPINSDWPADVCFEAQYGLTPDIAPCPKTFTTAGLPRTPIYLPPFGGNPNGAVVYPPYLMDQYCGMLLRI
jgi:hypothetical protein